MYFDQLRQIIDYLNQKNFKTLQSIRRVGDNLIELQFDRNTFLLIDLHKGASTIMMPPARQEGVKKYSAAFDTIMHKRLNRTQILGFELVNEDKIMRLKLLSRGQYKEARLAIQFEFTGKYTNAIILDEQERVLEALRHIERHSSSRVVRVGAVLEPVPKPNFRFKSYPIEDVEAFLKEGYEQREATALKELKSLKIAHINKQLAKLKKSLQFIPSEAFLLKQATQFQKEADVILANIYQIKGYETHLELFDFEGQKLRIDLDKSYAKASLMAQERFNKAKKFRQKAKNSHIERENLQSRISFLEQLKLLILEQKDRQSIERLYPKQKKSKRKKEPPKPYEVFWFDEYKILLGRNTKANQKLLEDCKANDMWFHLKDRPSAHVVVVADKRNIPPHIIKQAAQLCVDFSVKDHGRFSVDYTRRKALQLQENANVLYNDYETIIVKH